MITSAPTTRASAAVFTIQQDPGTCRCSACGSREVISRGHAERQVPGPPHRPPEDDRALPIPRVECQACGRVRQVKVPFADPRQSYTKSFERYVLELSRRMTIKDVAHHLDVGWDMVKDIQKRRPVAAVRQAQAQAPPRPGHRRDRRRPGAPLPHRGHGPGSGAVVFVGDGKGADALKPFWKRVRPSGARIEAVAMDMSGGYQAAVRANLPKAVIVFDRFHVVKLFNDRLSDLRRQFYREATDVQHKAALKGTRWLLLKNAENLDPEKDEKGRLKEALKLNEPLRAAAYYLKEDLRRFREQPGKRFATTFLDGSITPGGGVGDQGPPADGQDAGGAPERVAGVLRRDDLERADGGDEQQDQDDEAPGLWIPGPRVLQAEDPGDP